MKFSRRAFVGGTLGGVVAASTIAAAAAAPGKRLVPIAGSKVKIFDPRDRHGFGRIDNLGSFCDVSIVKRGDRWWMYAGGRDVKKRQLSTYTASLPPGAPLSSAGWSITTMPGDPTTAQEMVPPPGPELWDGLGARHCASYVRGWDPALNGGKGGWEERLYYAGATPSAAGPYAIGYLVWNGDAWIPHGPPVFTGVEPWEFRSTFEPNLIYHDGKWRMWYVAGPDRQGHVLHGYAESVDGRTNWSRKLYWSAEQDIFDNAVIAADGRYEAVFARFALPGGYDVKITEVPASWGLWWHFAEYPHDDPRKWSAPVQILAANDGTPWHAGGVWKPVFHRSESHPDRVLVFFNGGYSIKPPNAYTLGCIECRLIDA